MHAKLHLDHPFPKIYCNTFRSLIYHDNISTYLLVTVRLIYSITLIFKIEYVFVPEFSITYLSRYPHEIDIVPNPPLPYS
ncbi:hypothetical protein R0K20_21520, partial [Staphylococcus sp. SIMBA_130]